MRWGGRPHVSTPPRGAGAGLGLWRGPLKVSIMLNKRVAMLPAVSASGIAAMTMCAKVLVKSMNCTAKSIMRARVSLSWFFPNTAKYQDSHIRIARTSWYGISTVMLATRKATQL